MVAKMTKRAISTTMPYLTYQDLDPLGINYCKKLVILGRTTPSILLIGWVNLARTQRAWLDWIGSCCEAP